MPDLFKYTSFDLFKLRIVLVNFIIFAWFNVAMTSGRLSFRSDEIDKIYLLTLALLKDFLSHMVTWPAATRVFIPTIKEAEERDPGNEVESTCDDSIQTRPRWWKLSPLPNPCSLIPDSPPPKKKTLWLLHQHKRAFTISSQNCYLFWFVITTAFGINGKVSLDYRYLLLLSFLRTHLVITDLEYENVENMTVIKYICTRNSVDDIAALKPNALKSDGQGMEVMLPRLTKLFSRPRIHCLKNKITNRNIRWFLS